MASNINLTNLERLHADNPNSILFAALANRYIAMGLVDKALALANRGVDKYPDYAYGQYVLALCYYHSSDLSRAKNRLEISLGLDGKNPRAWKLAGEINRQMDLPRLAEECKVRYFLLDQFSDDAVQQFEQQVADFNEADFGLADDNDSIETIDPEFVDADEVSGTTIDLGFSEDTNTDYDSDPFADAQLIDEDINISRKVEEVFKETLGDMSIETNFSSEDLEEAAKYASVNPAEDDSTRDESADDESDYREGTNPAIDVNQLFAEFEKNQQGGGTLDMEDDDDDDASQYSFATDEEDASKPLLSEDDTFDDVDDDFLDFSSVVEEIISERDDDSRSGAGGDAGLPRMGEADNTNTLDDFASLDDSLTGDEFPELSRQNFGLGDDSITNEDMMAHDGGRTNENLPGYDDSITNEEFNNYREPDNTTSESINPYEDITSESMNPLDDNLILDGMDITGDITDITLDALDPDPSNMNSDDGSDTTTRFGRPPILSPTLGEIYIAQGRFEEAIEVFQQLLEKDPGNQRFQKKIADIQLMLNKQQS